MRPEAAMLIGKTTIVTGSGSGIGNAIALTFANFGADVVLNDIDAETLAQAAKDVRAAGRRAVAIHGDIRAQATVDRIVDATVREFGKIDVLVNNVGKTIMKRFNDMTFDEWMKMLDTNLIQVMRCTKAVTDVMIKSETKGSIINITTIEAFRAAPGFSIYAAAKAGLTSLTQTLGLELGPYGIRVNAIAPDSTPTPGTLKLRPNWNSEPPPTHIALGRRGKPDDHAGAALYLASDLSSWVTGETIHVGGGTNAAKGFKRTASGHWSTDGVAQLVYSGKPLHG